VTQDGTRPSPFSLECCGHTRQHRATNWAPKESLFLLRVDGSFLEVGFLLLCPLAPSGFALLPTLFKQESILSHPELKGLFFSSSEEKYPQQGRENCAILGVFSLQYPLTWREFIFAKKTAETLKSFPKQHTRLHFSLQSLTPLPMGYGLKVYFLMLKIILF
jgi:hypothetical protein